MPTRRLFLGSLIYPAGAAVLAAPRLTVAEAGRLWAEVVEQAGRPGSPDELARDEDYWSPIARAFTIDRTCVNLNNGGVSPSPAIVQEAMKGHLDYANRQPPPVALWRTQEPFASTLAVSRDRIVARQADGTVTRRLQAQEEPALRAITQTLFALLSADLAGLAERFQIEGDMDAQGWRLLLTPRDPALARWLRRVELEGDRFLRSARLLEASEDATLIRLARHAAGPALSAAEEAQFD